MTLLDLIQSYAKAYSKTQDLQAQPEDDAEAARLLGEIEAVISTPRKEFSDIWQALYKKSLTRFVSGL